MNKRILVIDDDKDILDIVDILFSEEGYQPLLYQTGTTIDHIKMLNPDLILLDIRINGFDKTGDQICNALRGETGLKDVPVLLFSAEQDVQARASSCGANGYISKPFDIDDLLSKVKELLS